MLTGNRAGRSTAAGLALWMGLSMPALLVLGALLKATTHHRGLGGATFGVLALFGVTVSAVVARRLVQTAKRVADKGYNPRIIAAAFAAITLGPLLAVAFPLVRGTDDSVASQGVVSALVDGAIFVVAAALAANAELRADWAHRARTWGIAAAVATFVVGFGWTLQSQTLGRAIRTGGGLAAALMGGLSHWTDRDGDGDGAYFGGGDCDEGDPSRHPGAVDIPGDGIDQDCDGKDAIASAPSTVAAANLLEAPPKAGALIPSSAAKPNIVLITLDTVRADHTSAYGYDKATTPNLARIARSATLFGHAYAVGCDTQRALMPLVSAKAFSETAHDQREWSTIASSVDTVAERMKAAGYLTAAVTSFTWLSRERGFDQGFDSFDATYTEDHPERGITGPHAVRAARAFLAKHADDPRPVFLWVHLFDAHENYLPHTGLDFGKGKPGLYDGEIAYVDRQVGELFDTVRHSSRGATTAIFVHGSNGEALGEHDTHGHGKELYDEALRVPLLVSLPGQTGPQRFDAGAVSILDVPPTVLELGGANTDGVSGKSLVPIVRGDLSATHEIVFAESSRKSAVVEWPLKLIISNEKKPKGALQLFDLSNDSGEIHDLSGARSEDVQRLKKLFDARSGDAGHLSSG